MTGMYLATNNKYSRPRQNPSTDVVTNFYDQSVQNTQHTRTNAWG